MVEYSKVSVNLSDTKLKKLKTSVKNKTEKNPRMWLKMLHENDLPHELLLPTRQRIKLRNAFNNNMSTNLKLSKAQISKIIQSGWFLGSLLGKLADPLMKVAVPLAKNVLASLGITAAASAIDEVIQKKIRGSGRPLSLTFVLHPSLLTLINSNKEMNDIMKIVQALEDSDMLLKGVTKSIKIETRSQRRILKHSVWYFRS